jgi:hypothetical protein
MQAVFRAGTLVLAFWIALFAAVTGFSQDLDGPKHIFSDALLDHMVGN